MGEDGGLLDVYVWVRAGGAPHVDKFHSNMVRSEEASVDIEEFFEFGIASAENGDARSREGSDHVCDSSFA